MIATAMAFFIFLLSRHVLRCRILSQVIKATSMRVEPARNRKEIHLARLLSTQNHSNRVESSNSSVLAETRLRQMTNLLDTFMLSTLLVIQKPQRIAFHLHRKTPDFGGLRQKPTKSGQKYWKQCEQCRTEYLSYLLNYSVMRKIIFLSRRCNPG